MFRAYSAIMANQRRAAGARDPFLDDVNGSIVLLRQHSFLRYQKNQKEYELKRRAAIDGILHAVAARTGVALGVVYDVVPVENLREASVVAVRRLLKAAIASMKRELDAAGGAAPAAATLVKEWERAAGLL